MTDLTQTMNLNPSSIYATFDNKHTLFSLTIKHYVKSRTQYTTKALKKPTLEKIIRALFDNTVAFLTTPNHPPTCMTLAKTMDCSINATPTRNIMTEIRKQNKIAMKKRFLQAQKSEKLSKNVNVNDYTQYLSSILTDLSIQTANDSTKTELKRTSQITLQHLNY